MKKICDKPTIGIVGMGVVGTALYKMLHYFDYTIWENDKFKDTMYSIEAVRGCDIIFICLPTPVKNNGTIDMSAFDDVFPQLTGYKGIVVVKSTVLPGTCEELSHKYNLDIVSNPEFLTEANSNMDMMNPHKIVLGGEMRLIEKLLDIYGRFKCDFIITDKTQTAELIKYACNCALAMKVSFANEMYDIAESCGATYEIVKQGMYADKRIGKFMRVTKERGFGGMCFPKDTSAFYKWSKSKMVKATMDVNKEVRMTKFK